MSSKRLQYDLEIKLKATFIYPSRKLEKRVLAFKQRWWHKFDITGKDIYGWREDCNSLLYCKAQTGCFVEPNNGR